MLTLDKALKGKLARVRDCCAQLKSVCKGYNFVAEMHSNIEMMEADARTLTSVKIRQEANEMIRSVKALIDHFSTGAAAVVAGSSMRK